MKKLDYLKLALQHNTFSIKGAVIAAFSVTRENDDAWRKNPYYLRLVRTQWGCSFVNGECQLETIEDAVPNEPLFTFRDVVKADPSWAANITEEKDTIVGNLFFNATCILSSFGKKFPYQYGSITIAALETIIAGKLEDTPMTTNPVFGSPLKTTTRSDEFYYVDEYLKFIDALQYISAFMQLATVSATQKGITAPPGIKEFKASLIEKYGDTLTDPVILAKFEKELQDFDAEYLKGDEADGTFISGKIRDNVRKRLFLAVGADPGFTDNLSVVPVTNSLNEGWDQSPKEFTALVSGLRSGSYSRGAETIKGGVSAKHLLRAANNFTIVDTDCGSKLGIHRLYNNSNYKQLANRFVIENGKTKLVENITDAAYYLDKPIIVRSPMYCQLEGDNICKVCAGLNLAKYPTGITIPLTGLSAMILAASMKIMHNSKLNTARVTMGDLFS